MECSCNCRNKPRLQDGHVTTNGHVTTILMGMRHGYLMYTEIDRTATSACRRRIAEWGRMGLYRPFLQLHSPHLQRQPQPMLHHDVLTRKRRSSCQRDSPKAWDLHPAHIPKHPTIPDREHQPTGINLARSTPIR